MKNIHVLPTDKPSRLFYSGNSSKLTLNKYSVLFRVSPQNIYITNDEEIKANEWFYSPNTNSPQVYGHNDIPKDRGFKKIILTTDQDLINDGVQAIDDEFLEWFVKNPNCEWVKVRKNPKVNAIVKGFGVKSFNNGYRIVIPKEEPNIISNWLEQNRNPEIDKQVDDEAKKLQKQHLIDMMKQDEELGLYKEIKLEEIFNEEKKKGVKGLIDKHKQETLEEASWKFNPLKKLDGEFLRAAFIKGAKWQQERSYSEEDMAESFMACWKANVPEGFECKLSFNDWFEQFKKK